MYGVDGRSMHEREWQGRFPGVLAADEDPSSRRFEGLGRSTAGEFDYRYCRFSGVVT